MARCIAFHSYKGGTGKTTIACNLAALLAAKGYRVSLLDLDVYAPSIHSYFDHAPRRWINDMLSGDAAVQDVMVDMTGAITRRGNNNSSSQKRGGDGTGRLWIGFSNPGKEEIYRMDGGMRNDSSKIQLLRKFVRLREDLISEYGSDYIIIDTSPGIRYWSINSLAVADVLFLTLKFGDLDIEGTKKMAGDIYGSFTKFGTKSFLLLNRVAGYCVPGVHDSSGGGGAAGGTAAHPCEPGAEPDFNALLSKQVAMEMISAIPCYCDIQFSRKEFLTVLKNPSHPFARQLEMLAASGQIKV